MTPDQTQPTPTKNRWTRWYMWIVYSSLGFSAAMMALVAIAIAVDDGAAETQITTADARNDGSELAIASPTATSTPRPSPTPTAASQSKELDERGYCIELRNPIRYINGFIDQTNGYIVLADRGNAPTNTLEIIAVFGESMNDVTPYLRDLRGPKNAKDLEKDAQKLADTIAEYAEHIRDGVDQGDARLLEKADDNYTDLRRRTRNLEVDLDEYCKFVF